MVANKYAFLQITRRRFLNEWEAFKKVISRRNIRRRITKPLPRRRLGRRVPVTRAEDGRHGGTSNRELVVHASSATNARKLPPACSGQRRKRSRPATCVTAMPD